MSVVANQPPNGSYEERVARFRAAVGDARADLILGLRNPRDDEERRDVRFFSGAISLGELEAEMKADAGRPLNEDILRNFFRATVFQVRVYVNVLDIIVRIATDQHDPQSWRYREAEVDRRLKRLRFELPIWKEHITASLGFYAELRASHGLGLVTCKGYSDASAHKLVLHLTRILEKAWDGCKEIAHNSRTAPQYLNGTSASSLFFTVHFPKLPAANDLIGLLEQELAMGVKTINERASTTSQNFSAPGSPPPEYEKAPRRLNDTEQTIVDVLGQKRMTGEGIAKAAHYPFNAHLKATLASLVKRGILVNKNDVKGRGYEVARQLS